MVRLLAWQGVALAVLPMAEGIIVRDFPRTNKSFNLSCTGNDL